MIIEQLSYVSTRKLGTGPHSWQPSIDDPQRCQVWKHAQVGVKDCLGGPIHKVVSSVLHCCFLLTKTAFQPTSVFYPERTAFAIQNLVLRFLLRSVENPCQTPTRVFFWTSKPIRWSVTLADWVGAQAEWPVDLIKKEWPRKIPEKSHTRWATSGCYPYKWPYTSNKFPWGEILPPKRWRKRILQKKMVFGAHLVRIYKQKKHPESFTATMITIVNLLTTF